MKMKVNAIAASIAALFISGTSSCTKAAEKVHATYHDRAAAVEELLPAFAAHYKAETVEREDGTIAWHRPNGKGTKTTEAARKQLDRLLSAAFKAKGRKVQHKTSPVESVVKALVKLTDAQFARAVAKAKEERRG